MEGSSRGGRRRRRCLACAALCAALLLFAAGLCVGFMHVAQDDTRSHARGLWGVHGARELFASHVADNACHQSCFVDKQCTCLREIAVVQEVRQLFEESRRKKADLGIGAAADRAAPHAEETAAAAQLEGLAPLAIKIEVCNGLINQRIALLEGIALGVILGAQVLLPVHMPFNGVELPKQPTRTMDRNLQRLERMFDLDALQAGATELYRDHWCKRSDEPASKTWCHGFQRPALLYGNATEAMEDAISILGRKRRNVLSLQWGAGAKSEALSVLEAAQREFYAGVANLGGDAGSPHVLLDLGCTLFSLAVDETTESWSIFWRLHRHLKHEPDVREQAAAVKAHLASLGVAAQEKAATFGFAAPPLEGGAPGYNVLHLRAEEDWQHHCEAWMGLRDGYHRDNCMNNTMLVHNVLLSEGVHPGVPLYIATGLTRAELSAVRIEGPLGSPGLVGLQPLFELFTVALKEDVIDLHPSWATEQREFYAAVDYELAQGSRTFVGNSVSSFSAFIIIDRYRHSRPSLHYNGGNIPLAEDFVKPVKSLSVPTLRQPLKWVFALNVNNASDVSNTFWEMTKVAVISAKRQTDLVAVCVTTAPPTSPVAQWLVGHGVRVIYHRPTWADELVQRVESKVAEENMRSHLSLDPDAMLGTFLRIEVPVLGLLDEFVLYTDVDVMFTGHVDWDVILGQDKYSALRGSTDFARGKGLSGGGRAGEGGLPRYFSASSEMQKSRLPGMLNAGVMLLNMRALRESYDAFRHFIFSSSSLDWPAGPGDQGAYKTFYSETSVTWSWRKGRLTTCTPIASFLPFELNWKTYWPRNDFARIIHFHGPKCQSDIIPYKTRAEVTMPVFKGILEDCAGNGDCYRLCEEFFRYLGGG
uniref:Nucleotide-diphospho-sugar transferase domain-containing protein n=1 Tax=Phaeomonas parva TaxID=124430 RepID=A0A7S1XX08_9STRA